MFRHKNSKNTARCSASSKARGLKDIWVDEDIKIAIHMALERFQRGAEKELEFPSSFTHTERAFVHRLARSLGYVSKSHGKGIHRYLMVKKKDGTERPHPTMMFSLTRSSRHMIQSFLQRFPISKQALLVSPQPTDHFSRTSGRVIRGVPQVPPMRCSSELDSFRTALPLFQQQNEILHTIRENQVVLILGETGSGKTTQIPQFLLDDCSKNKIPCQIFCTQPRRLATIAVAERVAAERGEIIGQTVGFQIRMESRVSPKTLLTFCTSGVLLRTLMAGDEAFTNVTHVIVDEVHERDGLTDFLLTKMKEMLQKIPSLRLILSSAALNVDLFVRYFTACPVIHISGSPYEVKQLFLEDVLRSTGYSNTDMKKYRRETQKGEQQQKSLTQRSNGQQQVSKPDERDQMPSCVFQENPQHFDDDGGGCGFDENSKQDVVAIEPWLLLEMDSCISNIFLKEDSDAFSQIFNLIMNDNISVNYRHTVTGATALMVMAGRGHLPQIEKLLLLGADVNIRASNGWLALDWARHFGQAEAADLLESAMSSADAGRPDRLQAACSEQNVEDQELLRAYHHSFDDEKVDLELILHLLCSIMQSSDEGAVLVFLPGYEEIVSLRDRILFDDKRFIEQQQRFQVFLLHSNMQTSDQRKVLKPVPPGIRKIILSTNIAETSITVTDVVFVIDSGKVKEKAYDSLNNVNMLNMMWISKASALQRKGRAGRCRPGLSFHLFSRLRYNSLLEHQIPQLLRMPLQELCLHTKLLAPINCPIAEFLSQAPEPPHIHAVKHAVQMLKTIDAMDPVENLTDLGFHLADMPMEPHLGKMVLCGVLLKCLDPIMTIASTLAHREPFILPTHTAQKQMALMCRKRFAANTYSDHMALLRAFQLWLKARNDGWERSFCEKNSVSQACMEMIFGMRSQLLGRLRATGFVRARGSGDICDVNQNSDNWAVVKAALVAALYPNLIHVNRDSLSLAGAKEKSVRLHPSSVLSQPRGDGAPAANGQRAAVESLPTNWLIYEEMSRVHGVASVRCCSVVSPLTVAVFGGCAKLPGPATRDVEAAMQRLTLNATTSSRTAKNLDESSDSEAEDQPPGHNADLCIDEWLQFKLDHETAACAYGLRQRWQSLLLRRMHCPSKPFSRLDESTIHTLVSVLTTEEQAVGLEQPTGVGQRPQPLTIGGDNKASRIQQVHTDRSQVTVEPCESAGKPSSLPNEEGACVRYFIMKSSNLKNIQLSQQRGVWSTSPANHSRLSDAFHQSSAVFLVFSVQGSHQFQGYARMTSDLSSEAEVDWGSFGLGCMFSVSWIRMENLPFQHTQHLLNSLNHNLKVQISRDGQEVEPQTGSQLLHLWDTLGRFNA